MSTAMSKARSFVPGRSGSTSDPDEPKGLPAILWALFSAVLDKLLREVKKKDCSPAMLSIAVSFLKMNEIKASKAQGSVYTGLESLVRRSGLGTPFTPSTSATNKNDEEETEE
jgi:hypothetical protein